MSDSIQWWLGPLVLSVLRLLYFEAATERARRKERGIVFPASVAVRSALLFLVVVSTVGIGFAHADDPWMAVVLCLFLLGVAAWWPAPILVSSDGIRQRFWWGRTKAIQWNEVTGADRDANGYIIVHGINGTDIQFSTYHVDRHRFEAEVQSRSHITQIGRYEDVPSIRPRSQ